VKISLTQELLRKVPVSLIVNNPFNSRVHYDAKEIRLLADSLERDGLLSPIKVRPKNGLFEIAYGHRRARAAELLGWKKIRAEVDDLSDGEMIRASLIENIRRKDLSDYEKGLTFKRMHEHFSLRYSDIARIVESSESHIANYIRMTQLFGEATLQKSPQIEKDMHEISEHHARILHSIRGEDARAAALRLAVSQSLSVRELQHMVQKLRSWFPTGELQELYGTTSESNVLFSNLASEEYSASKALPKRERADKQIYDGERKLRVAIGSFGAESNALSLEIQGDGSAQVITSDCLIASQKGRGTVLAGFIDSLQEHGIEIVPLMRVFWRDGGVVESSSYESFKRKIIESVQQVAGNIDGILLDLHGAMISEMVVDAEGELLKEIRSIAGDEVPIISTMDLHANLTDLKFRASTAIFGYRTNPHIDLYERGRKAALTIVDVLAGRMPIFAHMKRVGMIGHNLGMSTWAHNKEIQKKLPFARIMRLVSEIERKEAGLIDISIFIGFPHSNIPESVVSIVVLTRSPDTDSRRIAEYLAKEMWDSRFQFLNLRPLFSVDEAVDQAMEAKRAPVILADVGDNSGGGASCDSTVILGAILKKKATHVVVPIRDPPAVMAAFRAGVGSTLTLQVGGKIDPRFSKPVEISGKVKILSSGEYFIRGPSDCGHDVQKGALPNRWLQASVGRLAVVQVGSVEIILTEGRVGMERDFYKAAGIDPAERKIVVVKSQQAHRVSFESIAARIIEVDTPGVTSLHYSKEFYSGIPRQVFPLTEIPIASLSR
jgi:ParB/RepB/Spo0J family partition protein